MARPQKRAPPHNYTSWRLCELRGRCAGGRLRRKRLAEVRANQGPDFTEIETNQVQQDTCDGRHNADVRYLAKAAGGFVVTTQMRMRRDLQEEEQGKQCEQDRRGQYNAAAWQYK